MSFFWAYADTYSPVLPLIVYLIYKNKVPKHFSYLLWYLIACTSLFGLSNVLADRGTNNHFIYHLFALVELILVSLFFYHVVYTKAFLQFIRIAYAGFVLFFVSNILFLEGLTELNGNTMSAEFLLLIIYCFMYLFELINSKTILSFEQDGTFWIVAGLLIYCTGALLSFAFYKYVGQTEKQFLLGFWKFQIILYILKNIFIAAGFLCYGKK